MTCTYIVTYFYYATALFTQGSTFKANELLWAVYPPYTQDVRDVLEVLNSEIMFQNVSTQGPSRSPLERPAVMQWVDVHDFGGRTISTNE